MTGYREEDIKRILRAETTESPLIEEKMQEAYEKIRRGAVRNKKTHIRRIFTGIGAAAAIMVLAVGFCAVNPALAAELPILGGVMERVQELLGFRDIPKEEIVKLPGTENLQDGSGAEGAQEAAGGSDGSGAQDAVDGSDGSGMQESSGKSDGSAAESTVLYQAKDQGYTFTLTEYYASNQAIFLGVRMESEEAFPEMASALKGSSVITMGTIEDYSFRKDDVYHGGRYLEGQLEDDHTFVGMLRIDYESINVDGRKYDEAYREAEKQGKELPGLDADTWGLYMREYEIPEEMTLNFEIEYFYLYSEAGKDRVRGSWKFPELTIVQSDKDVQVIEIGEVNEEGIGLETIEVSPVEITLHPTAPSDRLIMAVALDKNGKKLPYAGTNTNELAVSGYDVSEITVYICDYDEYMEIKGYALQEDGSKFKEILNEKALYQKTVILVK